MSSLTLRPLPEIPSGQYRTRWAIRKGTRPPLAQGVVGTGLISQDQLALDGLPQPGSAKFQSVGQRRDGVTLVASRNADDQSLHDTSH